MDLLKIQDAAGVILFDLRLSEGEIEACATAIEHLLHVLSDNELNQLFSDEQAEFVPPQETRDYFEMTYGSLVTLLREHCDPQYIPRRFRGGTET